jgi:glycosyltransferase involved in cell wall biosynthesis
MPEKPLVSIITVSLNDLEGLKRTVTSVFGQTWQEFEYIIIDGGSADGSKEYIESLDDKIEYWVSEQDSGVYNAMNKGIKAANGEYLLFLNSGDHLLNNEVLKENNQHLEFYELIYFNIQVGGKEISEIISYPKELRFSDFYFSSLGHPSTFIKKVLFEKVGIYDEKLDIVSDWKFFILALFKHNCSYKKVDNIMTTFYRDGISSNPKNEVIITAERKEVLNTNFQAFLLEIKELYELRAVIQNLKKSKKIKFLLRLGLLNKF